ncbi:hypothetical protein TNCV_203901 [Trichonephila clavipes]|nr:hypothetical protein TNCV_203901 [Trichonephila clavipes]
MLNMSGHRHPPIGVVSNRGWSCHDFEPSITKDPPCGAAICRELKRPPNGVVWELGDGVPAQVSSSTSLDHGSTLRGPSPKALV